MWGSPLSDQRTVFFLWHGHALFCGRVRDNTAHRHHALQVVVGLQRAFGLHDGRRWQQTRAAVIAPDHPHRIDGAGGPLWLLLVEPEWPHVRGLADTLRGSKAVRFPEPQGLIAAARPERVAERVSCAGAREAADRVLTLLEAAPRQACAPPDPRVAKALSLMRASEGHRAAAADLARRVHLSASRLAHLFKDQVGIPMRRYLLWLRLIAAVRAMLAPASFTTAAHAAGFADAAHLSRTFRRMFGLRPSDVLKDSQFVQAFLCERP
jgi:AraC-like DNA-binding protein